MSSVQSASQESKMGQRSHAAAPLPRTIKIEFPNGGPSGVRIAADGNWAGRCVVCPRAAVPYSRRWLDEPGVYLLAGSQHAGASSQRAVYIGQADSVADRLTAHLKHKEFWHATAAVYRRDPKLHAGDLHFLEASCIKRARSASMSGRNFCLVNKNEPSPAPVPGEEADMESFLASSIFFFAAFGFDFFSAPQAPAKPEMPEPPDPPESLRGIIGDLATYMLSLPNCEFYRTGTPDSRAKVISGDDFRVFARLGYRKRGVRLELLGVGQPILIRNGKDIDAGLIRLIASAHANAEASLRNSGR